MADDPAAENPEGAEAAPAEEEENEKPSANDDVPDDFDENKYELIGKEETEEQKRKHRLYQRIEKDIGEQNKLVDELKVRVTSICAKKNLSHTQKSELFCLKECLKSETTKLRCLINEAIALQNFGAPRHWSDIVLETTIEEDTMMPAIRIPMGRAKTAAERAKEREELEKWRKEQEEKKKKQEEDNADQPEAAEGEAPAEAEADQA